MFGTGVTGTLLGDMSPEFARMQALLYAIFSVGCAVAGAAVARVKGSSALMGALLGLCCSIFGVFFATRLPDRGAWSGRRRPAAPRDVDDVRPIPTHVANRLGLPPQRHTAPVPDAGAVEPVPAPAVAAWTPSPPSTPSGWWAPDPTGRFVQRWWDGAVWTHRVLAADGSEHVDTGG